MYLWVPPKAAIIGGPRYCGEDFFYADRNRDGSLPPKNVDPVFFSSRGPTIP